MVTFGGAYAVLGYIRDVAVGHYGWLERRRDDGRARPRRDDARPAHHGHAIRRLPRAWHHPEGLPPSLAGTLGALVTTWVTFVPCFIWIFLGAPYIERLRGTAILTPRSRVTAAVVGVILNLALLFALHVFSAGHLDVFAVVVTLVAFPRPATRRACRCRL